MAKIEPKTPLEQVLYEERKFVLKERDEAREELQILRDKYKDDFGVSSMHSDTSSSLIIKKGTSVVSLNREEISEVLKYATSKHFI